MCVCYTGSVSNRDSRRILNASLFIQQYTAKETAAKAEKAKKRRFNRQQDDNESEKVNQ